MGVGSMIRARRRTHGLTQARLALRAGTSQAAISRIEREQVCPGIDTVANLLLALGEELEPLTRPLAPDGDPARLAAQRALPLERRIELAWSWNRLGGEIAAAGARARGET